MSNWKRVSIDIEPDQYKVLVDTVPWGLRKHLLRAVVDVVVKAIQKDGQIIIGAILDKHFSLVWNEEAVRNSNTNVRENDAN